MAQQFHYPIPSRINGETRGSRDDGPARHSDGLAELPVISQGLPKSDVSILAIHLLTQPGLRQIEHAVAEALLMYGLSVVPLTRLDQDHTSCRALAPLPTAEEILDASMGHAHQPLSVMVHVVSMAMELCRYGFDPAVSVTHKMHEILMNA
jgi:hypothetical protein